MIKHLHKTFTKAVTTFTAVGIVALMGTNALLSQEVDRNARLLQTQEDITWLMNEFHAASGIPGVSLAIGYGSNILLEKGFGLSDISGEKPVLPSTRFRLGEVGTLFTASAIMKLVSEGRVDLDADVRKYVPEFPQKRGAVTIRQLLSHTGGITHFDFNDYNRGQKHIKTLREALKQFSVRPLLSNPGSRYVYSSYGYVLLGLVIENVTGQSYDSFLNAAILSPLLINDLHFDNAGNRPDSETKFYNRFEETAEVAAERDFSYVKPAAGINGTPASVVKLLASYWSGLILDPVEWIKMLKAVPFSDKARQNLDFDPALAWRLSRTRDNDLFFHMDGKTIGSTSAYLSYPRYGLHVAYAANARADLDARHTSETLVEPMRLFVKEDYNFPQDCPVGVYEYRGNFGAEFTKGQMTIVDEGARCTGLIETPGQFRARFISKGAPLPDQLKLLRLSHDENGHTFAVVTPLGLYQIPFKNRENGLKGALTLAGNVTWVISAEK
ncbi:serine hydrolase domain-containing protein [Temperatibacter marinus]|uniref:Serine hydrolase domain-containing protein n=1 Tax=Temperatibacter marinus TaxID=1456591 RepID=A0AA52H9Q6_9PROT|nr:serine hydrolase domain-containing protein [Temperatibacter marinus]WND03441.1 serine hydrolase domain-containing protein [Temperatibacter marinus]